MTSQEMRMCCARLNLHLKFLHYAGYFVAAVGIGSLALCCTISLAQSAQEQAQQQATIRLDAWRQFPKHSNEASDTTDPDILNARGQFFDKSPWVTGVPLDEPQPQIGRSGIAYGPGPELPFFPNEAIVVARFIDWQPYLTLSHLNIYTKITMRVEQVLSGGPSAVTPGQTIDVLIDGGAIVLDSGKTIKSHIFNDSGNYSLQPDHRYALFLQYHSDGKFFTDDKDWELNGIAIPDRLDEASITQQGRSQYSGLSEAAFLEAVKKAIKEHP